jgi:hypothetical protein
LPLWNTSIDGTGQSIAIVGESNIDIHDVENFRSMFGLAVNDPEIILDGPDPGVTHNDVETEALLDVEWAGAVAPGAKIKFIASASTNTAEGVDLSALYAVDNNVAPVLSVSFGLCELFLGSAGNQFHSALWEQAAAEGITVLVASGDSGSAGCDRFEGPVPEPAQVGLAVSGLASTPFNVAVGGTDFMNFGTNFMTFPSPYWNSTNDMHQASAAGYIPETTWDSSCTSLGLALIGYSASAEARCNDARLADLVETLGGSGGKSNCTTPAGIAPSGCSGAYAQPPWQSTVISDTARDLPDVSLFASNGFLNSFYIMCEADALPGSCNLQNGLANFLGVGGTSASTPAFAGIMALVNQYMNSLGLSNAQGNANYELYQLSTLPAQKALNCNSTTGPNANCIFNDVTFGTIAMPCSTRNTASCAFSNPGDNFGVLTGYDSGTAYNLATGLGSVNANNLVRNWNLASFHSTLTTLTLQGTSSGPVNLTHGDSIPVGVRVTNGGSGSGTPTGDVSLIAGSINGEGVDSHTLSGGTASWNTNRLPGGTNYNVRAHYGGDGVFGASDSGSIAVTVAPEASTTAISALMASGNIFIPLFSSIPYGSPVYLRADVGSAAHPNADTAPSGTVTFADSYTGTQNPPVAVPSTPYKLNSEGAAIAANGLCTLSLGTHSVTAIYSGDNSYQPSGATSPTTFTISPALPQVTVPLSHLAVAVNSTFMLNVRVGENLGRDPLTGAYCVPTLPSGTVSVMYGGSRIASATLSSVVINLTAPGQSAAVMTVSTSSLPIGEDSLTVTYGGDANYLPSTSQVITVQVGYFTSMTLSSSNLAAPSGTNVTFTAQVTTNQIGGPAITGNVQFQIDGSGAATAPVVNGTALFTTTFVSAVPTSHQIKALYSGDTNYIPSLGFLQEGIVIPDFTLSDSISNLTIAAPGQSSAPITLTITGTNGYNGTIAFSSSSCVITPAGSLSTCSFSPSSITGSGSAQVVINTTAPHSSAIPMSRLGLGGWKPQPIAVCLIALIVLAAFKKRGRFGLAFSCLILVTLLSVWSCGGASGGSGGGSGATPATIPGTPTGVPYTVSINASASGINSHTTTFTFVVQ